jgi:hypothetical protein
MSPLSIFLWLSVSLMSRMTVVSLMSSTVVGIRGNCLLPFVGGLLQFHFEPFFNVAFHWGDIDLIPDFYVEKIIF